MTLRSSVEAIDQLPGLPQPLEFLARVLYRGEEQNKKVILATPIYVAFAE